MTWSILARDADGTFGAAVASRFFAVGALCLHTASAGALSTQALMNPLYGPRGLALLREGLSPAEVVSALIGADAGREHRQLHVIGTSRRGRGPHGRRLHRLVRPRGARALQRRGQHARGPGGAAGDGADFHRDRRASAGRATDRSDGGRRGRGRRQARQAVGGPAHPRRRGLREPRPARGRPRRTDRRAASPVRGEPRALSTVSRLPREARRSGGHHRSRRNRGAHRALSSDAARSAS